MTVLFATHSAYLEHLAGPRHPERPERLDAVLEGVRRADLGDALSPLEPLPAERVDLERVHPAWYLERMETMCAGGGGRLDPDTYASSGQLRRGQARRRRRAHRRCRAARAARVTPRSAPCGHPAITPRPPSRWASA